MTVRIIALSTALAMLPLAALAAGNAATEITSAATHAGLAAKAGAIDGVHAHMQHALNCVVGPKGEGYDAAQLDPCKNAGAGIIPDSSDTAAVTKLKLIASELSGGIKDTNLATAQATASKVAAELNALK